MKIIVSARDVIGTGGGTVSLETARYFAEAGHDVHFVADTDIPMALGGSTIHVTPLGNRLKAWTPSGRISFRIRHCLQLFTFSFFGRRCCAKYEKDDFISIDHNIEAFGGDIIVLHNVFLQQFRTDRRHWFLKIPQFFNPVFGFRLIREQIAFRSSRVKAVVAVAQQTLDEARPYIKGDKLQYVIQNGINLTRFHPLDQHARDARRCELGVSDRFVLLFVGHEFERKRLDLVLQALSRLPQKACLWVIGGRGSSVRTYAEMAERLGVADRVTFLGTVRETERYFQAADVFVLPSDYEAWPLVVMEAMACGTPVLMTPVGCASFVIRDGETGYVVDYNGESIAEKALHLLDHPHHLSVMRRSARSMAEQHGWDKVARKYLDAVSEVWERMHVG